MSSEVKRYDQGRNGMRLDEDGPWVPWEDYAALEAECDALRAELVESCQDYFDLHTMHTELRAEVQRLREALDTIYHTSCYALNAPRRGE